MSWEALLKVVVAFFALSGWFKVYYDHISNKPKIRGRILVSFHGEFNYEKVSYTAFFLYPFLVNARKNIIHILDYEAYVQIEGGWVKLTRAYGAHDIPSFSFMAPEGEIKINNLANNFIYRKNEPVQHGVPLHGWLMFLGSKELHRKNITAYKLVCVDVNLVRHEMLTQHKDLLPIPLASQIAEIDFPQSIANRGNAV